NGIEDISETNKNRLKKENKELKKELKKIKDIKKKWKLETEYLLNEIDIWSDKNDELKKYIKGLDLNELEKNDIEEELIDDKDINESINDNIQEGKLEIVDKDLNDFSNISKFDLNDVLIDNSINNFTNNSLSTELFNNNNSVIGYSIFDNSFIIDPINNFVNYNNLTISSNNI
ncbi:3629_t:CDS:2, partial [Cetraspora pellucida]